MKVSNYIFVRNGWMTDSLDGVGQPIGYLDRPVNRTMEFDQFF
jgi:hypothetical protein